MITKIYYKIAARLRRNQPIKQKTDVNLDNVFNLVVVLTQYKRDNIAAQLEAIENQSLKPDIIIIFQNGRYHDISKEIDGKNVYLVRSDFNTKYFGRFAYCLGIKSKYIIIMDDDIIPASNCFNHYIDQVNKYQGIIGGNGRIATLNPQYNELKKPSDVGIRPSTIEVDFVGHLWCFKHEWLKYMFKDHINTLETGEDMHFCFSAKIHGGIKSYAGSQPTKDTLSDKKLNYLGTDRFASYKTTTSEKRISVENYFVKNGFTFIERN